jgi:hypothetical protein
VEILVAGAQQHLEEDEVVREVVQVQTGESPWKTAGGIANLAGPGAGSLPNVRGSFALMATERHVYAMLLKGARLTRVEEASLNPPLSERGCVSKEKSSSCRAKPPSPLAAGRGGRVARASP